MFFVEYTSMRFPFDVIGDERLRDVVIRGFFRLGFKWIILIVDDGVPYSGGSRACVAHGPFRPPCSLAVCSMVHRHPGISVHVLFFGGVFFLLEIIYIRLAQCFRSSSVRDAGTWKQGWCWVGWNCEVV